MSANDVLITARNPKPVSAHGACSRDEPQPKLSPASRICAPCGIGRVQDEVRLRRTVGVVAPVGEQRGAEAGLVGHLEIARGNDLIRVDVVRRDGDRVRFDRCELSHYEQRPHVGDLAGDGGRGGRQRRDQERAAALALPSFEVAVAGADGVLAGLELIAVHGDAHRAAGFAPLGAGVAEDVVETFRLRLRSSRPASRARPASARRAPPCGP